MKSFFLVGALFLVQNALERVTPGGAPPLLLIGVVFFALSEGPGFGLLIGSFAGVFLELFATGRLGAQIAAMGLVGLACGFVSTKIFRDGLPAQLLLPVAGLALWTGMNASFFGGAVFSAREFFFAALVSPLVFGVLKAATGRR